jgi:CRISPR-associated protein Cas2
MLRAYILSYDIADAKRGRAMHKLAKAFGRPLQYSVFACTLRREDRVRLAARIESVIDAKKDRVIILDIGTVPDRESWIPPFEVFGCQEIAQSRNAIII